MKIKFFILLIIILFINSHLHKRHHHKNRRLTRKKHYKTILSGVNEFKEKLKVNFEPGTYDLIIN